MGYNGVLELNTKNGIKHLITPMVTLYHVSTDYEFYDIEYKTFKSRVSKTASRFEGKYINLDGKMYKLKRICFHYQ